MNKTNLALELEKNKFLVGLKPVRSARAKVVYLFVKREGGATFLHDGDLTYCRLKNIERLTDKQIEQAVDDLDTAGLGKVEPGLTGIIFRLNEGEDE